MKTKTHGYIEPEVEQLPFLQFEEYLGYRPKCARCHICLSTSEPTAYPMTEYHPAGVLICYDCYLSIYKQLPAGFKMKLTPKTTPEHEVTMSDDLKAVLFYLAKGHIPTEIMNKLSLERSTLDNRLKRLRELIGHNLFTKVNNRVALSQEGVEWAKDYLKGEL